MTRGAVLENLNLGQDYILLCSRRTLARVLADLKGLVKRVLDRKFLEVVKINIFAILRTLLATIAAP